MNTKHFDHVIFVLKAPDGHCYAYHEAIGDYHQYRQKYRMPHCGKQLQVNTNYKGWSGVCKADPYYKKFKPVTRQELVEIYDDTYPQTPVERIDDGGDDDLAGEKKTNTASSKVRVAKHHHEPKSAKQESQRNNSQIKPKSTDGEKQKEPGNAKPEATAKQTTENVIHGSEQLGLSI